MSITDDILRQYAEKRANKQGYLEGFQARQGTYDDIGYENGASNYLQLFSQGGTNLLKAIDAPSVRSNLQREEMMKGEQLQNQRDQEAAKLEGTLLDRALHQQELDDNKTYREQQIGLDKQRLAVEGQRVAAEVARNRRQDQKLELQDKLVRGQNSLVNAAYKAGETHKKETSKLFQQIENNKVDYVASEDGSLRATSKTTPEGQALIDQFNERVKVNPVSTIEDQIGSILQTFGNEINAPTLMANVDAAAYSTFNTAGTAANKALEHRTNEIGQTYQDKINSLIKTAGFSEGSIGSSILNEDISENANYGPAYMTTAVGNAGQFGEDEKTDVTNEFTNIAAGTLDKLNKDGHFNRPLNEGGLSIPQYWKIAGDVAAKMSKSFANFGHINNSKYEDRLSAAVQEAAKANMLKGEIENLKKEQNTKVNKAKIQSFYGGKQ